MKHAELLGKIRDKAGQLGVLAQHFPDSRRAWLPGWPDLMLIGLGGVLFREIKTHRGRVEPAQWACGDRILKAGGNWAVWREHDWHSGLIEIELYRLALLPRK